ncbi:MAG: outer membrane lipoprotein-sorting protein [Planctomycetota bacterium]
MKAWTRTFLAAALLAASAGAQDREADNKSGVAFPTPPTFPTDDPAAHGRAIAEFADLFERGYRDEILQGEMTLLDADGDSVRRGFSRMVLEQPEKGDKLVIKFLSPAEIKGVSALTHENPGSSDDNWLYLPANKRVRRISGANNTASFQGTEFTYEDLSNLDPSEYEWRFLEQTEIERDGERIPVYKLDAKPTYDDTGYSHIVVYYHRTEWRQERMEYFDKAGQHLKTRDASDWRLMHGRFWRSHLLEMDNHQTGKRTRLVTTKYFLNLSLYKSSRTGKPRENLSEDLFTTRALES